MEDLKQMRRRRRREAARARSQLDCHALMFMGSLAVAIGLVVTGVMFSIFCLEGKI